MYFSVEPFIALRYRSMYSTIIGYRSSGCLQTFCLSWRQVPRIEMPSNFTPTDPGRSDFLVRDFWKIPLSWIFSAIIPAMGVSVLLFLETGMTGLLMNKEHNQLKKGGGYNLDLFIIGRQYRFLKEEYMPHRILLSWKRNTLNTLFKLHLYEQY